MTQLRPNHQRAKNAILLLWIVLVIDILSLTSGYFQYDLLTRIDNGEMISEATAGLNDLREQLIGIIALIALIVTAVLFIQWFRRAYYNLHQKVNYLEFSEGWAAGAWFVPIINLFRPYKIMKELYIETNVLLKKAGSDLEKSTSILIWWWILWLISGFLGNIVARITLKAETLNDYITATELDMISNIIGIPLALLAVRVIKNYSELENELYRIDQLEPGQEVGESQ